MVSESEDVVCLSAFGLLDAIANRLAARLLVISEKRIDVRALTLARLNLDTLRKLLGTDGEVPPLDTEKHLAARVAEQLSMVTR